MQKGFTLIELMIVCAIISILATIALPNYQEATTRSRISATKVNMRTVAGSLELYRVDYDKYPAGFTEFFRCPAVDASGAIGWPRWPGSFDTIILSAVSIGPFGYERQKLDLFRALKDPALGGRPMGGLMYFNMHMMTDILEKGGDWSYCCQTNWSIGRRLAGDWLLSSIGPVRRDYAINHVRTPLSLCECAVLVHGDKELEKQIFREYDPTNGLFSEGRIFRTQRKPGGLGVHKRYYTKTTTEPECRCEVIPPELY